MSPEKPKDKNPRPVWMDNLDAQLESRWKEHCEKTAAENPPPLRPEEFRATEDGGKEVLTGESWENIQKRYEAAGWKLLYRKQKAMSSM